MLSGSPHGSVMSCQSLAARAFTEPEKESMTHCGTSFHRTVRFSSESRSSSRGAHDVDCKRETPGSMSLTALSVTPCSSMSQSAPGGSGFDMPDAPGPPAACRFPKLEECAHFHYERVSLGGISVETTPCAEDACGEPGDGWVCLAVRSHVNACVAEEPSDAARALSASWTEASDVREWTLIRSRDNLLQLDTMLHRCIYDRKVSGLPDLSRQLTPALVRDAAQYRRLIADYLHHFSIIADDSINCGPVLNWLQMDNKGHKLLVSNEDSSSINTPAVAAAYSVRKYVSQARDELSFEVGDMISIIDMPGPQESLWWRGKRGFRVGFFPHRCVAVIGDKVPRHMTQPPPIVGSVAVAPIKPVLRKHGKLISLFRSFILSRPSRRSLKQQGILKERVFGCDLGEHLLNCGRDVPLVLVECATAIESRGAADGVYRLSGGTGLTQRLRAAFDAGARPDLAAPHVQRDPHAVPSLLKMYFRELPNPLCTYQLYEAFVRGVQAPDEAARLRAVRDAVAKLPPPHYRTLAYLMRHLRRVSLLHELTGMTARNMAIVWAPNLLRSPRPQHALQGVAVQVGGSVDDLHKEGNDLHMEAVVTEFLICYAEELFAEEQGADSGPDSLELEQEQEQGEESPVELRGRDSSRRPKSLPLHPPTKLLSLEEARRRGKPAPATAGPPPSGAIAEAARPAGTTTTATTTLRPTGDLRPKYIEVGSGPNNLPQYHTVLDLPLPGGKRGVKRSPSGWRTLFTRGKQQRAPAPLAAPPAQPPAQPPPAHTLALDDVSMCAGALRPVKSCESLTDADTLPPGAPLRHHARSASCDSYFEPWQAELAGMRLRLAPQERDHHMFSEEDDTAAPPDPDTQGDASLCSTPADSAEPSPRRLQAQPDTPDRRRCALEEQLAQIGFIDGESPRARPAAEKRHSARAAADMAKRLCKDRESPLVSPTELQSTLGNVKLRERNSPRKMRNSSRYSGLHQPLSLIDNVTVHNANSRLSWHGKDGHSTLIKIDWPIENSSISNLTNSTLNSSPLTPVTPVYDALETDSDASEANKHTITIKNGNCNNCDEEKCLKCELKATDYEHDRDTLRPSSSRDSLEPSPLNSTDISYHNLNRLSAVSTSSSDRNSDKRRDENELMKTMTSSHGSSSSYSNLSPSKNTDEMYESYGSTRPNYINLQSSSTSKSSPGSPLKTPLKSTISITFRSPTKAKTPDYEIIDNADTPTNDRDSVYEDVDLEKNLSIVEEAPVPETDASLPTQQACQPDGFHDDLIILETPSETNLDDDNTDVYSQVKFFRKSIEEVNAMILESPEKERHYENVAFAEPGKNDYENINVDALHICDKDLVICDESTATEKVGDRNHAEKENGNIIKTNVVPKNLNVRELANRFESPTEQKGPFMFKTEIKYPSLERKEDKVEIRKREVTVKPPPQISPKTYKLSKSSTNARSLDESAFVKEFGDRAVVDRRKSMEVRETTRQNKFVPDLNLNLEETAPKDDHITPTSENKICLVQRLNKSETKSPMGFDADKKLSRERIEKYKEERRNFLREKYSSQSFRSSPEQLTRIKIKKEAEAKIECERLKELPKFERRNTVDLGQRMRFSLARSSNNLDTIKSPVSPERVAEDSISEEQRNGHSRDLDRKEKISPSYNIRDMAALFEQKSQSSGTG